MTPQKTKKTTADYMQPLEDPTTTTAELVADPVEDLVEESQSVYSKLTQKKKDMVDKITGLAFAEADELRKEGKLPGNVIARMRVNQDDFVEEVSELLISL